MITALDMSCDTACAVGARPLRVDPTCGFPVVDEDEFLVHCTKCGTLYVWKTQEREGDRASARDTRPMEDVESWFAKTFGWLGRKK